MKKLVLLLVVFSVFLGGRAWAADQELKIYIWTDYMDEPMMAAKFQEKFGIKVRFEGFESIEEMMAKLQSGGISQYDIICLGDYNYKSALKLKLIQPLDHSKIPNLKNVMPQFRNSYFDPGNKYHVPWQWGFTGLIYRKDRIDKDQVRSWSILFDPRKNPGPFYLLDSTQELLAITLSYLGLDPNSTNPQDLKAAIDLLVKTKKRKNCLGFKGGVGARTEVAAGTVNAAITYNGDALRVIDEEPQKMSFTVPQEGAHMFMDTLAITRKATNPDAAHKWMNWILEPEVGAWISNYVRFATPNKASLPYINKDDRNNPSIYPSDDVRKKLFYLKDPGENMKLLDQAWTRIKAQ
jgi:spermidine/putrescine transport system substrate-binding protein